MEKKLNNGDDGIKRKSIDDHERRRQAEKSHAVEQQRRARAIDGPRLVRDVMIKQGLQRQPAEREYINTRVFEASMPLEKLVLADQARESQRDFEPPIPEHKFVREETDGFQAYEHGYAAGWNVQDPTVSELKNPDVVEGYIKGLEEHRTNLHIGKYIENAHVSKTASERIKQLLTPAYEGRVHHTEKKNLEMKPEGPELDR